MNPNVAKTIFHPGCNPEPLNLEETGYVISIVKVSQDEFKGLSNFFKELFSDLSLNFNSAHDSEKQALVARYDNLA